MKVEVQNICCLYLTYETLLLCQRDGRLPSRGSAIASSLSLQMDCFMICFQIFLGIEVMLTGLQFPWFFNLLNRSTTFALFWPFENSFVFQKVLEIVADSPQPVWKHLTSVFFVLLMDCYTSRFYSAAFNRINVVVLVILFHEVWANKSIKHFGFNFELLAIVKLCPNLYLFASWDSCEPNPWDLPPPLTLISSFTTPAVTTCVCVREVMKVNLFFRWHSLVC